MQLVRLYSTLILLNILTYGCCTLLAMTGYWASNPNVRNFLIRSGLSTVISRKAEKLYEVSNFRDVYDQGTDVRKAQMETHDIIEMDPNLGEDVHDTNAKHSKRSGFHVHENLTSDGERMYSERLFKVVNEMDRKGCISRLLCEIGADAKSFGIMGMKIHHYIKSVPPVTWNSATFPYLESFSAGLGSSREECGRHYNTCRYNLKKVMKFLWIFMSPIKFQLSSGL